MHLAAPARELVDSYLRQRMIDVVQNDIEKWVDARWDKKRDWLKAVLSWGSLAALVTAGGLIWGVVKSVVSAQVTPAVELAVGRETSTAKAELESATNDAKNVTSTLTALRKQAEDVSKEVDKQAENAKTRADNAKNSSEEAANKAQYVSSMLDSIMRRDSGKVDAVTKALEDLFKKYPRETGGMKEQLELPLGTIILIHPDDLGNFVNGHMEWVSPVDTKLFDSADAKWTLADKRDVLNSAYARVLGYPKAPDGSPLAMAMPTASLIRTNPSPSSNTGTKIVPVVLVKINY